MKNLLFALVSLICAVTASASEFGFTGRYRPRLCAQVKSIAGFTVSAPGEIVIAEQSGRVTFHSEKITGKGFFESYPLETAEIETRAYPEMQLVQTKKMLATVSGERLTLAKTVESVRTDATKSTSTEREIRVSSAPEGRFLVHYIVRMRSADGRLLKESSIYKCSYQRDYL